MVKGIDTATPLTAKTAAALRAAGYAFVGRYLVPATGTLKWKALTKAEAELITGAGLRLLTVWETTADRAKGGAAAGLIDGRKAKACAEAIGMPRSGAIYFAVDYDAGAKDMEAVAAYLIAAEQECRPYEAGVYGGYKVIEAAKAYFACTHFWQCVAWSYGKKSPALQVYQAQWDKQICGVRVDVNECADMDKAGIWTYEEEDMDISKLTEKECYEILQKAQNYAATLAVPDWAKGELDAAKAGGITDGTRPMQLIPRYQAAIMAGRAAQK